MSAHRRQGLAVLGMLSCTWLPASAWADPYWVAYDGDAFPEDVGWKRHWGDASGPYGPGADRWIEDGVFVLDSLRDDQIFDYYDVQRPIDPAPGELFIAEWRVRVDQPSDPGDAEVVIARDPPGGHIAFQLAVGSVVIDTEGVEFAVAPGAFHTYRVESEDMQTFELFIDGLRTHEGSFEDSLLESFVGFGDGVQGRRSLSRWDRFQFGTVAEPTTSAIAAVTVVLIVWRRRLRDEVEHS